MKFGMFGSGTMLRASAGKAMLWRSIGTFPLEGKRIAALSNCQTKFRGAPASLDNERSAPR
jgi:hypothetical protein